MTRLLPLLMILTSGCAYLSERAADFGDCWKLETHLTFGGAWVQAGPFVQDGLGAPEGPYMGSASPTSFFIEPQQAGQALPTIGCATLGPAPGPSWPYT